MLRLSLRKRIICLLLLTGCFFLFLNIHQKSIWTNSQYSGPEGMPGGGTERPHMGDRYRHGDMISEGGQSRRRHEDQAQQGARDPEISYGNGVSYEGQLALTSSSSTIEKPWFFRGGKRRPVPASVSRRTHRRQARLWPHEAPNEDRITNQLMFRPPVNQTQPHKLKKILFYYGLSSWNVRTGRDAFLSAKCPVDTCTISSSATDAPTADAIIFKDRFVHPGHIRPRRQVWILYFLECPYHTQHIKYNDVINWTATYRRDSDLVAPYERWTYYDPKVKQKPVLDRNYASNKTKSVAWFVSNCAARNNRLHYAHELKKHIAVDIYGACGDKKCPRFPTDSNEKCFQMLDKDYRFYLAFENSNCRDYITEKFFVNGLGRDILPIVMGAHPDDYARSAPEHSYIHVDDFKSPKDLAAYLHKLTYDDELYNSYFRWKGTGEFINTYFLCRLCAMLHDDYPNKSYRDINEWWRGRGICTTHSWPETAAPASPQFSNRV